MSNQPEPFEIKPLDEDKWSVNMEGNWHDVQTKEEAEILSQFPIEFWKNHDDNPGEPDENLVKKIIDICEKYRIAYQVVEQFRHWYKVRLQR